MTAGVMTHYKNRLQNGFSYLFTLFLVAFLGVSLTVATELYSTSVQRDKEKELLFIGAQFSDAIGSYFRASTALKEFVDKGVQDPKTNNIQDKIDSGAVSNNNYPDTIEDLLIDKRSLSIKRHLRKVFIDPMTGSKEWGELRIGGKLVGIYSLSNKTPIKQTFLEDGQRQLSGKSQYSEWVFSYPTNIEDRTK